MPWIAPAAAWRIACGTAACVLAVAGCSGTVEASYRPPAPPPPSPAPIVARTPTPVPTSAAPALACGPDQVAVELGTVQSDATSRAVPVLIRGNGPVPCGVANPVGLELLDAAGQSLDSRVETAELPPGRTPVDSFTAEKGVMVWLQWRAEPSTRTADPATDCLEAQSLQLTLARSAPPIPITATIRACDGGTVYVSPAEPNVG